jgi:large conductance mechanosensitive channel
MLKEFREFISRGNVIDLAVAVVIGVAFTAIVIFMIVRTINQIKRRFEREKVEQPPAAPEPSAEEKLLMEIRDLLRANVENRRM